MIKFDFLLNEISKRNIALIERIYFELSENVKGNDDIFNFLSCSNIAKGIYDDNERNDIQFPGLLKSFTSSSTFLFLSIIFSLFLIYYLFSGRSLFQNEKSELNTEIKTSVSNSLMDKKKPAKNKSEITLKSLEKKYGQLVKVSLKNGKSHIGAFFSVKDSIIVITSEGKIVLSSEEIQIILPYKINK